MPDYQPTYRPADPNDVGLNDSRPRPPCKRCKQWPALNTGLYCRLCKPEAEREDWMKRAARKAMAQRRREAKKAEAAAKLCAEQMSLNIEERTIDL